MSRHLFKSTAIVSAMTFISRVSGFLRDMVVARIFGAGEAADAFFVAFRIPNFLRRLFGEGAFASAFVPVLSEYRAQREHDEVRRLAGDVAGTLGGVLFGVTLLGVVAAPLLLLAFAPGFAATPDKQVLAADLLRILFPYILFISLAGLAGSILNAYGRFAVPALTPVLLNLSMIVAAVWLAPHMARPIEALAWGVFVAGVAQLLMQLPLLARLGLLARPRWAWGEAAVQRIVKLMLPAMFGASVAQVNLLLNTVIASFLVSGSVSWLYYSDRLVEFPLGILGVALATVTLPALSRTHATAAAAEFSRTLDWALRLAVVIGLPATVALIVLSGPLLVTLFHYDAFTSHDVLMAQRSLMAFAAGLLAYVLIKVLVPGFYARQDTRTPVRIGVITLVANMLLSLLLVWPLAHAGLALATALAACLNAILLYRRLRHAGVYQPEAGWGRLWLQVLVGGGVMGAMLWWGAGDLDAWLAWSGMQRVGWLALWVAAGAAVYFTALWLLGLRPAQLLRSKVADN